MTNQDQDQRLDVRIDNLSKDIQPPKDLWAGIEHAIEIRESERRYSSYKLHIAACFCVFVIGGFWLFNLPSSLTSAPESAEINHEMMSLLIEDMDRGFNQQKAQLLHVYDGRVAHTTDWKDQLNELESARAGIKIALAEDPENRYMIQLLQSIQQQQLDLIESVHAPINTI